LGIHEVLESAIANRLAEPMFDAAMDLDQTQSAAL
jgi:hypothetical protein